jgi:hypothetical protein
MHGPFVVEAEARSTMTDLDDALAAVLDAARG